VRKLPNGLLLMGDTVCRIDPVFGQGMSIAILEALALQRLLSENNTSLQGAIKAFHKKTAKIIAPIWNMVLMEDFRYPNVVGKKPTGLIVQQWFSKRIFLLSAQNQHVYDTFIKVMNLVQPMTILMHPKIILSVIKHNFYK
jgi:2-polyprenyl-6-methoxyphenol hydroxylase-like FAD-dependent oxidoreductase